jgi:hypothetical protein
MSVCSRSPEFDGGYIAFISYRNVGPDRKAARWLHRSLERFRTPKQLVTTANVNRVVGRRRRPWPTTTVASGSGLNEFKFYG